MQAQQTHAVVSAEEWQATRLAHLEQEKAFTRQRDALSQARRELPWQLVEKEYLFDGPEGQQSLADLFGDNSQLIVYHFMYGQDWDEGCPSCSYMADNFNGIVVHLENHDISMVAISSAPLEKLEAYKARMGWDFKWLSAENSTFNQDYRVTFTAEELNEEKPIYNFDTQRPYGEETPGISVFFKDDDGQIYRTYSTYSRGLDMMLNAYHYMDLTPKGRNEEYPMSWLKRNDSYDNEN